MNDEQYEFEEEDLPPSKSELKRQMAALQKTGERLVNLSNVELARIPLPDQLDDAITTARRIKSREGLRRHLQYIGKVMRRIDCSDIEAALADLDEGQRSMAREFHALEALRDRLSEGGKEALAEAIDRYPHCDRQHLRQLQQKAHADKQREKNTGASRKLFRYLRELHEADEEMKQDADY